MSRTYPSIRMMPYGSHDHPTVAVTMTEGGAPVLYCGDPWCNGGCTLPALVIPGTPREERLVGDMVAVGATFQPFRAPWTGAKIAVAAEHVEDFRKRLWL